MSRLVAAFALLSLFLCSVGCRLCDTPYDYRISGNVDRCGDYRGFSPTYRAGSVLNGDRCNTCPVTAYPVNTCSMVIGDVYDVGSTGDLYDNAGNYGTTTPVSPMSPRPATVDSPIQPRIDPEKPGVPQYDPTDRIPAAPRITIEPRRNSDGTVPSVEQLLQQPRGTMPDSLPIIPPPKPRVVPPSWNDAPVETVPFSPNDAPFIPASPVPPGTNPTTMPPTTMPTTPGPTTSGLQITLEELRRLDPSVHDLQIISIEDASVGTPAR